MNFICENGQKQFDWRHYSGKFEQMIITIEYNYQDFGQSEFDSIKYL